MIINLISGPRNISTALMYAFAQRDDMKVLDEPFYGVYLSRFDIEHPGKEDIIATYPTTVSGVLDWVNEEAQGIEHLFIKNMGHHLIDIPLDFLNAWKNIFLVRNPKQLIASFAQVIPNPTMQDIAIQRQAELFDYLKSQTGQTPIVIDSNEVLKDPGKMLRKVCELLEIPFTKAMLSWNPNEQVVDVPWAKYWYANVQKSSGFAKQKTSSRELPERCQPLYEAALPYYDRLARHALRI